MSSHKTENYRLHIWEPEDNFLREEFNGNFEAIDRHMARMAVGAYVGDGAESQFIELGFTPAAILVMAENGTTRYTNGYWGGLAVMDRPANNGNPIVALEADGFRVYYRSATYCNGEGHVFHYLAIR